MMRRLSRLLSIPLLAAAGCSGGSGGGLTLHLTASGLSQKSSSIHGGGTVKFVNDDTVAHQIMSDPHPAHTGCVELNGTSIAPGASWSAKMSSVIETCTFHDEANPTDVNFQGTIQTTAGGGGGGGWIVGASGLLARLKGGQVIVANAPTPQDLLSLYCVSPSGWAAGAHGSVIYTADDGDHWVAESAGVDVTLRAVAFANQTLGLAAGDGGALLRTTDAGAHWTPVTATTANLRAAEVSPDGMHAWAAGDAGTLLYSVNGGAGFQQAAGVPAIDLRGVRFATMDPQTGFAVGADGSVLVSHDAGATWSAASTAPAGLNAVQVSSDASRVIAVGAAGTVWFSADGGASFHSVATGVSSDLYAVGFADGGEEGWAAGAAGTMARTLDAGAHFGPMESGTTLDINSVENER